VAHPENEPVPPAIAVGLMVRGGRKYTIGAGCRGTLMRYYLRKTFTKPTLSRGIIQPTRTAGLVFLASPMQ
jgi:hypothetical protein